LRKAEGGHILVSEGVCNVDEISPVIHMQNAARVIFLSHHTSHSNEQNSRAVKRKFLMATRLRIDLSD